MDVSIAVSLIRGQMGTVVERAVNAAVETVLAEMLKVVGVKFEELKAQLVLMKHDVAALQAEKTLKEKENDNIRAKLRYTELKLKYYRQGVEEELQHRAATSTLVRVHPPAFPRTQSGRAESSASSLTRINQVPECTSSQSMSRRAVKGFCPSDVVSSAPSELLLPVSLAVNTPAESVDAGAEPAQVQEDDCDWTAPLQLQDEGVDAAVATPPPAVLTPTSDPGRRPAPGSSSPDGSTQSDSSTLPPSGPQVLQVKQEAESQQQEEELIYIKEEPEEEVMVTLLLDCPLQQSLLPQPEGQRSATEWSRLPGNQSHLSPTLSSTGPDSYPPPPLVSSLPPGSAPHLALYEEFKLRRTELQQRILSRRRELKRTLPLPLAADLDRERREKTRIRVARWRAKRKLQACLNQDQNRNQVQTLGGAAAALCQSSFRAPGGKITWKHGAPPPAASSRQLTSPPSSSFSSLLPFIPSPSSSSLFPRGPRLAPPEHTVTSSSCPASFPQLGLSQQSISVTDSDVVQ